MFVKFLSNLAQRIPKKNVCICQPKPRYMSHQDNSSDKHQNYITEEANNFRLFYPEFKKKVLHEYSQLIRDDIENTKMEQLMDYQLTTNRLSVPFLMIKLYRILQNVSEKNAPLENADLFTVGWLLELARMPQTLLDDYIESSLYRRGIPCWHTLGSNYKYVPIDTCKVYLLTYLLFDRYLGDKPYYRPLVENVYKGQLRSTMSHTMDEHSRILWGITKIPGYCYKLSIGKTSFFIDLPINTAIYLAGYEKELKPEELTEFHRDLAYFGQMMNDYVDNFGTVYHDGTKNEPMNEDIKGAKSNWFLENAMLRASEAQKEKIIKHYGRSTDESIQEIISIYDDLQLRDHFNLIAEELQQKLRKRAKDFPTYFEKFVEDIIPLLNDVKHTATGKKDTREPLYFGQSLN